MKICALTPIKPGTEIMCKEQSKKLFDAHFVYPDTSEEWNDWNNRLMLLTIAKMQGFVFVVHIDHDELFQEGVTRNSIESDFKEMHRTNSVVCRYKIKEMYNDKQWRCDGIWNQKGRAALQINPFFFEGICWQTKPTESRFHAWPLQQGPVIERPSSILHYGMSTPEKRFMRHAKWTNLDPDNKWQAIGYDYLLDEKDIKLASAKPME